MPPGRAFYSVGALTRVRRSEKELLARQVDGENLTGFVCDNLAVQLEDPAKSMENRNRHVGALPSLRKVG